MSSPWIWNGLRAKSLLSQLSINDAAYILTGTVDPSSSATDAPKGSLYLRQNGAGNGEVYFKQDNGSSTNWSIVSSSAIATQGVPGLISGAGQVPGTTMADDADAGNFGESFLSFNTAAPVSTGTYFDVFAQDFTGTLPGDFEFSIDGYMDANGATFTSTQQFIFGVSATAGSTFPDYLAGVNATQTFSVAGIFFIIPGSVSKIQVTWDGTDVKINGVGTGSLLNVKALVANYTSGTPMVHAALKGRRAR